MPTPLTPQAGCPSGQRHTSGSILSSQKHCSAGLNERNLGSRPFSLSFLSQSKAATGSFLCAAQRARAVNVISVISTCFSSMKPKISFAGSSPTSAFSSSGASENRWEQRFRRTLQLCVWRLPCERDEGKRLREKQHNESRGAVRVDGLSQVESLWRGKCKSADGLLRSARLASHIGSGLPEDTESSKQVVDLRGQGGDAATHQT